MSFASHKSISVTKSKFAGTRAAAGSANTGGANNTPKDPNNTPMMKVYWKFRNDLPKDVLLLFRVGDFYEMFDNDAVVGAKALSITLTKRAGMHLAGVPFHAINSYVPRLLRAGHRVAICEQHGTPKPGKLVERGLSRILSPGTAIDDIHLEARRNNYLLALSGDKRGLLHASWLDISTAEFRIAAGTPDALLPVLNALDPREVIVPELNEGEPVPVWAKNAGVAAFLDARPVNKRPPWEFDIESGARAVADDLHVLNLQGFGIEPHHPALGPAGAILAYATAALCQKPANLDRIAEYKPVGSLVIDAASQRNLELFRGSGGDRTVSLFNAINGAVTPAGSRLLERWLAMPPCNAELARLRQTRVGDLVKHSGTTARLQEKLRGVCDISRILTRLHSKVRNPRDLGGIRDTLRILPDIRAELVNDVFASSAIASLAAGIHICEDLRDILNHGLADEMSGDIAKGGVIRDGYDAELDRLRSLSRHSKSWVNDLEASERERTGIKNLKIIYNGAFGYMIEVSKGNLSLVPDNYMRRQTVTGYERYTTDELKKKEQEILRADEHAIAREDELFNQLINEIRNRAPLLAETAATLAEIDVICGWASLAREWDYCRPDVDDSDVLEIEQGRHPVVEQMLRKGGGANQTFVPNDTSLQSSGAQIALLTGPNMAGKSTYIRQVALIALMAQLGAWVPAKRARVGIIDRLFCRVGASDELARGNSTFMVEMNETANILNNASANSLIILDEIGRGTSTYDGISIAWSVAEYLHGGGERGPRTLFATHYHELTRLAATLPRLRNFCVAVKEWNDEIIFVRQVIAGAADRSYGIHVARLAGMPADVVARANEILNDLENGENAFMHSPAGNSGSHAWTASAAKSGEEETESEEPPAEEMEPPVASEEPPATSEEPPEEGGVPFDTEEPPPPAPPRPCPAPPPPAPPAPPPPVPLRPPPLPPPSEDADGQLLLPF